MYVINARNVNDAFPLAMDLFRYSSGDALLEQHTRGERRLEFHLPVATCYQRPHERVLFDQTRDANPFFHFMESMWILGGRDDVAWIKQWLASIAEFSDDGRSFYGAYGRRMRSGDIDQDQLMWVVKRLKEDPMSTRSVVAIYRPWDASYTGKDLPCNTTLFFKLRNGALRLTVANRSNDAIWGAYGANVVQFSTIQQYVADCLQVGIGAYTQMSDSFHVYPDKEVTQRCLAPKKAYPVDPYSYPGDAEILGNGHRTVKPIAPMVVHQRAWEEDLRAFLSMHYDTMDREKGALFNTAFFNGVALRMGQAYAAYKRGALEEAIAVAEMIEADDWRLACTLWLNRRGEKHRAD